MRKLCLLLTLAVAAAGQDARLSGFDEWLGKAVAEAKVPGLAIAIVADGKVVHSKGYGYRDVGKKLPVTERTLFAIGSVTKSFTVATLGTLADEGKFEWDKPVREYLPGFRMFEPTVTEQLTTRDMVTHRSGLPRHDLVWYTSEFPLESLVKRLQYLPPSQPLRARFQYNNLMYATAGHVSAVIGGKPWEEMVRERLLRPLGMTHSRMNLEEASRDGEVAVPYQREMKTDAVKEVPPFRNMTVSPAGSIYSCVEDMAKYLQMHIDQGEYGGKRVVGKEAVRQMQAAQIVSGGEPPYPELEGSAYGMGLSVSYYRGRKMVGHNGAIDGMRASMMFLPKERIGVVVLWNLMGSPLGDNLPYVVFDRMLGAPETDWLGRARKNEESGRAQMRAAEGKGISGRRKDTKPSHALGEYAGTYTHPGYGRMVIREAGGKLAVQFNRIERPLEHFHYDTFQVPAQEFDNFEKFKLTFVTNTEGDIARLRANVEPNVAETIFERVADAGMFESSFLQPFTGEYESQPKPLSVTLRGTSQLLLNGTKLTPVFGTRFRLEGQTGVSVEFRAGEMVVYTPDAELVLKKR